MNFQYNNFKILEVSGIDTIKFLQGLVTSDLTKLSDDNNLLMTTFANLKGRIISLCFVKYVSSQKLLLSVEQTVIDNLLSWLKSMVCFLKLVLLLMKIIHCFYR